MYIVMEMHIAQVVFPKMQGVLNQPKSQKITFMVYSIMILGFIVSKEGKSLDAQKIQMIVNMLVLKNP